jgi:hypothetical protein
MAVVNYMSATNHLYTDWHASYLLGNCYTVLARLKNLLVEEHPDIGSLTWNDNAYLSHLSAQCSGCQPSVCNTDVVLPQYVVWGDLIDNHTFSGT